MTRASRDEHSALSLLSWLNSLLPPGVELKIAVPSSGSNVRKMFTPAAAARYREMRSSLRAAAKAYLAAPTIANAKAMHRLQTEFLTMHDLVSVSSIPPDVVPRLELTFADGRRLVDSNGTIFRGRPGRSGFAYGEPKKPGRPSVISEATRREIARLRTAGMSDRGIAIRLKLARGTVAGVAK